jgi:hypothetical protein
LRQAREEALRYQALDNLVLDVTAIEELYAELAFEHRTPLMKQLYLSRCITLINVHKVTGPQRALAQRVALSHSEVHK